MPQLKNVRSKLTAALLAATTILLIIVVSVIYLILSSVAARQVPGTVGSSSYTQAGNDYAVLIPATVPPKIPECSEPLSYSSNGDPSPIQCSNGAINVNDWKAMAALEPTVMKLGYTPTGAQVVAAICLDGNAANQDSTPTISAPLETNAYAIASLYYGWTFGLNPVAILEHGGC